VTAPPLPPEQPELFAGGERLCAIWTARYGFRGPNRLDVTRKGGSPLAPSRGLLHAAKGWGLGRAEKAGLGWAVYRERYLEEMAQSQIEHCSYWLEILRRRSIVLVCYCPDPEKCHRSLLAELLVSFGAEAGLPAQYCGETR
jgi:uncharacterized protein YeaO (DUF488 family)